MECDAVDWSKVALDPPKLLLKDEMIEARVKLADPCRRRRHIHRFLTSAQHHLHGSEWFGYVQETFDRPQKDHFPKRTRVDQLKKTFHPTKVYD